MKTLLKLILISILFYSCVAQKPAWYRPGSVSRTNVYQNGGCGWSK